MKFWQIARYHDSIDEEAFVSFFLGPDFETTQFPTDPLEDQAILDGMEPEYYEEDFDPSEHELKVKLICLL